MKALLQLGARKKVTAGKGKVRSPQGRLPAAAPAGRSLARPGKRQLETLTPGWGAAPRHRTCLACGRPRAPPPALQKMKIFFF